MVKKRGLGKSLDALLAYSTIETQSTTEENKLAETLLQLAVEKIQPGKYQPRREIDPEALEDLANSIRTQGVIQPIIVRPSGNNYELIAGERRWRAAQIAGLTEIPAIVREIPNEAAFAIALIENIQRENLNPVEEAIALKRLLDEFEMTHQEVADAVGKSRASVTNLLRLLALPEEIKMMLEHGKLEMGHARALITLPEASQRETAEIIAARSLSVREAEHLIRRLQSPNVRETKAVDPDLQHLQEDLSRQLKLRVAIRGNAKGKGKLIIHYRNLSELNKLLSQLQND